MSKDTPNHHKFPVNIEYANAKTVTMIDDTKTHICVLSKKGLKTSMAVAFFAITKIGWTMTEAVNAIPNCAPIINRIITTNMSFIVLVI